MHKIIPLSNKIVVEPNCSTDVYGYLPIPSDCNFVPTWFHVEDDVAQHFLITDIRVGRNSQIISTGCVPASLFADSMAKRLDLERKGLLLDTLRPGERIKLSVTNTSRTPQTFAVDVRGYYTTDIHLCNLTLHYLVGFGRTHVKPQGSAHINVQPQIDLRPQILFVPDHVRETFVIEDLWTSTSPGGLIENRTPATMLTPKNLGLSGIIELVPVPDVRPTQFLTLSVLNTTNHEQNIMAAVLGTAVPTTEETTEK